MRRAYPRAEWRCRHFRRGRAPSTALARGPRDEFTGRVRSLVLQRYPRYILSIEFLLTPDDYLPSWTNGSRPRAPETSRKIDSPLGPIGVYIRIAPQLEERGNRATYLRTHLPPRPILHIDLGARRYSGWRDKLALRFTAYIRWANYAGASGAPDSAKSKSRSISAPPMAGSLLRAPWARCWPAEN